MDRWDLLALIGVALVGAGLALVAPWLGITVVGVILLVAGVAGGVLPELVTARAAAQQRARR
jgi:hypothetical protein